MGVKYFYTWYKKRLVGCVQTSPPDHVDILAIDLNGIFHQTSQKLFSYGQIQRLLTSNNRKPTTPNHNLLFHDICDKINEKVKMFKPREKIVLCVDGVAGLGKMNQQRQRRFKSALHFNEHQFDPNSFTPGTKMMDHLTKYIDWFIRRMMTSDELWQSVEVIFSNEKVPGEGEHKIMNYLRSSSNEETVVIYGLDADLVMLTLVLPVENVYIARETDSYAIEMIVMKKFKNLLIKCMKREDSETIPVLILHDFMLMNFLVGNDFLPGMCAFQVVPEAIECMIDVYKNEFDGHLTRLGNNDSVEIDTQKLMSFFHLIGSKEHKIIEDKYNSQKSFFPDPIIIKNLRTHENTNVLLFDAFRKNYYESKFDTDPKTIVKQYVDGIFWIFHYYKSGMPDWTWFYPFSYAPLLSDLASIKDYQTPKFVLHEPLDPFLQLLLVLPETSKDLVPVCFHDIYKHLSQFFPSVIDIDITGKRKEWEGIVVLPVLHLEPFMNFYNERIHIVNYTEKKRNIFGKNFLYKFSPMRRENFSSFYGNITNCPIYSTIIHF